MSRNSKWRHRPINEDQISNLLMESDSDCGDFSPGSDDEYRPDCEQEMIHLLHQALTKNQHREHYTVLRLLRKQDRNLKMGLIKFRKEFITHLLDMPNNDTGSSTSQTPISSHVPSQSSCPVNQLSRVSPDNFHYLEKLPATQKKKISGKPCRVCTKRKESSCPVCPEKPTLCIVECFKIYHTDSMFV
ncbi:hypothetical protein ACJJTC_004719 [Scirpophaga incertulas]